MMSFQKIYGLYGLEHHTVEINGDVTMRTDGRTNKQTSENRATQSLDSVRLSFAMTMKNIKLADEDDYEDEDLATNWRHLY